VTSTLIRSKVASGTDSPTSANQGAQATLGQVAVELWIIFSVFCSAGGWLLSGVHQLNRFGYGVLFIVFIACAIFHIRKRRPTLRKFGRKLAKRFRRPLPLLFLAIAGCAFLGGLLYPPTNYDALAYRLPRILNWIHAEQWHWIHSGDVRLNNRGTGFEWLMTPVLLFARSERPIFLLNFLSFLLLPGLLFSVFTRLGIRRRVAWHWMWILPSGYNFILQAGSISNDSFAAIYGLVAVDYALRGRKSGRFWDFAISMFAIALLTGAKATNIPLGLVWLVAAWPILSWLWRRPLASASVVLVSLSASFLPMAIINHSHCGDWTGVSMEAENVKVKHPLVGVAGNTYLLLLQNLTPPFFLPARWYNLHASEVLPQWAVQGIRENFMPDFFALHELPSEDGSLSGIGFGVTALLILSFVAAGCLRGWLKNYNVASGRWAALACWSTPAIALIAVMASSGASCPSRLIAAYYPFLFGVFLLGQRHARLTYERWWKIAAGAVMFLALLVLLLTPPRPLFPARTLFSWFAARYPQSNLAARAERVYSIYRERSDPLALIRASLPDEVKTLGLVSGGNDLEVSLWRPYFTRRVVHIVPGEDPARLKAGNIDFVVLNDEGLKYAHKTTLEEWCVRYGMTPYKNFSLPIRASREEMKWYLVRR
jgi:hypothetical protein